MAVNCQILGFYVKMAPFVSLKKQTETLFSADLL